MSYATKFSADLFQFLMVRLKVFSLQVAFGVLIVSIPYGSIKRV